MTGVVHGAYAQLLSLGLLWTSFHCAGMCGTLLVGLDVAGVRWGRRPLAGMTQVLAYQAGRALTLGWLGAAAGLLGAGLRHIFAPAGAMLALLLGLLTIVWSLQSVVPILPPGAGLLQIGKPSRPRWKAWIPSLVPGRSPLNSLVLGLLMGFLPCMIVLWVLGLAAMTGSALHGASLMLVLVAMTTPMLLGITLLPRLCPTSAGRLARHVPTLLQGLSGVWLLLIGAAGVNGIAHVHIPLSIAGHHFMVMLF